MEANVAQGNDKEAAEAAFRYLDSKGADAFEIASTIRQLSEVWQLNEKELPGKHLLPICRAGHLREEGAAEIALPATLKEEANATGEAVKGLEKILGPDRMSTLKWYKKGLEQCNSVARVEKRSGKGHGTRWLGSARGFFSRRGRVPF